MTDDLSMFEHVAAQSVDLHAMQAAMDQMERTFLEIPADHPVPEVLAYRNAGLAQVEAGRKWKRSLMFNAPDVTARLLAEAFEATRKADEAGAVLDRWMAAQEADGE